jgi:hypothetical protein
LAIDETEEFLDQQSFPRIPSVHQDLCFGSIHVSSFPLNFAGIAGNYPNSAADGLVACKFFRTDIVVIDARPVEHGA